MMMHKHTKGPWRACYSKTNEFGGGNIRSDHHVNGTGALLLFSAGPMFSNYKVNREEEIANLRLVASAPQLLSALEAIVEDLESYCDDYNSLHPTDVTVSLPRLHAAIARAGGGDSRE